MIIPRKPRLPMIGSRSRAELDAILKARAMERRAEAILAGLVILTFVTLAIVGILTR